MREIILFLIKKYQKYISPIFKHFGVNCKYYPTCSSYFATAVTKYGAFRGSYLGIKRILRCNPFSKGGYDPVK